MDRLIVALATGLLGGLLSITPARALEVFACEPEWGALVRELSGNRAKVYVATTARQDPHRIEARPSLIARARRADLMVCTGADLEVGWLPLLQRQAGNRAIQAGQPGLFLAADQVALMDRPAVLDRSLGDLHPAGNPHLHLDPRKVARVAPALGARLAQLDPDGAADYTARTADFGRRWQAATAAWQARAAPLRGVRVVTHHADFDYLLDWLGMARAGTLEPRAGLPPTPGHLTALLDALRDTPARAVLRTPFQAAKASEWLAARADLPAVELPYTVGGADGGDDLFGLFEVTIARLLEVTGDGQR
jgi:zinc/manganese transport system substrate-binding protein